MSAIRSLTNRIAIRLANVTLDATSYAIACLCDNYPRLDERREIHMLRLRLNSYELRVSELETERDNYKAMHEMTHGSTLPSLPDVPDSVKSTDLN
jgi:hypothetical protein